MFKDGRVRSRWGYSFYGVTEGVPLNGKITALVQFERLRTSAKSLVALTINDAYSYDEDNNKWDFITKNYITGTVTFSGGSTAIVGSGTVWAGLTGNAASFKIGIGATAMSSISTWYDIASITDNTNLVLDSAYPGTATTSGQSYVIRQCFSGTISNPHMAAFPYDSDEVENIMVVTNGVDPIVKWTGSGSMTDLGGATGLAARYIGYFGSTGFEHTYLSYVTDNGTVLPQTLYVSATGDPEDYSDGVFYDIQTTNDNIEGILDLGSRLIIYKTYSISEAWSTPSGGATDPLDFTENKVKNIGVPTIRAAVDFGAFHIFLGWTDVYLYDGVSAPLPIATEVIKSLLAELNRNKIGLSFAFPIRSENLYCLFIPTSADVPDKTYVYNHIEKTWSIWTLPYSTGLETRGLMTAAGTNLKENALTWTALDALTTTWADLEGSWESMTSYSDAVQLVGDDKGYVYELSPSFTTDNSNNFVATVTTRDFPLNDPKFTFRLAELVIGITDQDTGSVQIRASVDFGSTWTDYVAVTMDGTTVSSTYVEQIVNFIERGKQVRFQITNVTGSYFELESLLVGYNDSGITR